MEEEKEGVIETVSGPQSLKYLLSGLEGKSLLTTVIKDICRNLTSAVISNGHVLKSIFLNLSMT